MVIYRKEPQLLLLKFRFLFPLDYILIKLKRRYGKGDNRKYFDDCSKAVTQDN